MESKLSKKTKDFRSKQQIEQLLAEQASCSQSTRVFCAERHIPVGTFYHWKEKYGQSVTRKGAGFATLQIVPSVGGGRQSACL